MRRKGDADSDAEARSGASKQVSPGGRPFTEPRGEAAGADDPTYGDSEGHGVLAGAGITVPALSSLTGAALVAVDRRRGVRGTQRTHICASGRDARSCRCRRGTPDHAAQRAVRPSRDAHAGVDAPMSAAAGPGLAGGQPVRPRAGTAPETEAVCLISAPGSAGAPPTHPAQETRALPACHHGGQGTAAHRHVLESR